MMETKPDKSNICYGCPETCGTDRPWDCPIIIKEKQMNEVHIEKEKRS